MPDVGSFGRGHPNRNALVVLSSESPRLNRRKTPDFAAGTSMALNASERLSAAREPEEMSLLRSCPGSCPWRNRYKDGGLQSTRDIKSARPRSLVTTAS